MLEYTGTEAGVKSCTASGTQKFGNRDPFTSSLTLIAPFAGLAVSRRHDY
jgi:hypothetical protein